MLDSAVNRPPPLPPYRNPVKSGGVFYVELRLRFALLLFLLVPIPLASCQTEYAYEMIWTYENRGNETYVLTKKDMGVPVFMNTSHQQVRMELVYENWDLVELNKGFLKAVNVEPMSVDPGETVGVTAHFYITSEAMSPPKLNGNIALGLDAIPPELNVFIEKNDLFPKDNPELAVWAVAITHTEDTVLGKTLKLVEWFGEFSVYTVNELPKRQWATLRDPRGDCDDLALLFISFCRSLGIPAYLQGGILFSETMQLDETDWDGHYRYIFDKVGWHAWAMVYIPPWGWLPVELTMSDGMRPVDAITDAYYWRDSTVVTWNITSHDYVQDEINQREILMGNDIYWVQRDSGVIPEVDDDSTLYIIAGILAVTVLLVYLRKR